VAPEVEEPIVSRTAFAPLVLPDNPVKTPSFTALVGIVPKLLSLPFVGAVSLP